MRAELEGLRLSILAALVSAASVVSSRGEEPIPKLNYEVAPDFFQLPAGEHFVEVAGVAVNSKGHIYVFHRGKHPLMEFDASGKFFGASPTISLLPLTLCAWIRRTISGRRMSARTWF